MKSRAPQQERSKKRVEQILAASQELIRDRGCAGLKMGDIADAAGITIGSIYQYFPNKQAIIATLAQRFLDETYARMDRELSTPPGTLEDLLNTITRVLESYYELYRSDPVVRDIFAGSAADKELTALDEANTAATIELMYERSKHLVRRGARAQAKLALRLMVAFAVASVELAVSMEQRQGKKAMRMAGEMLAASWAASLAPLGVS